MAALGPRYCVPLGDFGGREIGCSTRLPYALLLELMGSFATEFYRKHYPKTTKARRARPGMGV